MVTLAAIEAGGGARGRVAAALRPALREGRLHHAYLVAGPTGAGKRDLALALAATRLCPGGPAAGDACGACRSCRLVAAGGHPDVLPLVEGEGRGIPIDAVRALLAELALAPVEGPGRVAMIDPADALADAPANALLKTLEEPPQGALLLLLTARPQALLPTIRSRCLTLRLPPRALGADAGLALLERARDAAALLADPRQGDPYERAERAAAAIDEIAEGDASARTPTEKRRRAALAVFDLLLARLRGRIRDQALASRSLRRLEGAAARVLEACAEVEGNAIILLVLEVLAVDLDVLSGRRAASAPLAASVAP